jgi:hypothetical protein
MENLEPGLLQQVLTLNPDEVIVPLRVQREDVNRIKAVKLTDEEVEKVQDFAEYLQDRKYLPDKTFASLFVYLFNLGYTLHRQIAEVEAKKKEVEA